VQGTEGWVVFDRGKDRGGVLDLLYSDGRKCERNTEISNPAGFEQIDPTLRVLDYLLM